MGRLSKKGVCLNEHARVDNQSKGGMVRCSTVGLSHLPMSGSNVGGM